MTKKRAQFLIDNDIYLKLEKLSELSGKSVSSLLGEMFMNIAPQLDTTIEMFEMALKGQKQAFDKLSALTGQTAEKISSKQTDIHEIINKANSRN